MAYPKSDGLKAIVDEIALYGHLKHEEGAGEARALVRQTERELKTLRKRLGALAPGETVAQKEPDALPAIRALRPKKPRRLWDGFDRERYRDRVEGAFLARCAGCTLGAPVELWPVERMQALAEANGEAFPPERYWSRVPDPEAKRYDTTPRLRYAAEGMDGVPTDDDIAYTLLGLLILEAYGPDFTIEQAGEAWVRWLPMACTAEDVALKNLKRGIAAEKVGATDNPFRHWIGAAIRADPWGYVAPGLPEVAAELAWRDAYLSHRRNGIYGEMYFAACIAAAFALDDPVAALEAGLAEIPRRSALARAVRWALREAPRIRDWRQARKAMEAKFPGMSPIHTINNACLTVWGITIGGRDVTRVLGQTVAMGYDNDCTAATAGSIVGAVVGRDGVPAHWTEPFHNTVHSYLKGHKRFRIDDLVRRFARQAERIHAAPA